MTFHKTLLILVILALSCSVCAHRFYWNPQATLENVYILDALPLSSFIIGELQAFEADYLQFSAPENTQVILALLAPQACPDFLPELWIVAKTLPETQETPFDIPEGFKALKVENEWQPYRDYIISARLGPNARVALGETNYYFVIYAGHQAGTYVAFKTGRDTIGGTSEGFDALGRFVRCELQTEE